MKMELSIIVPVYNGEKYILNCLNSIYCQVLPKFEVIIVNDGSDEICLDIIKNFLNQKHNIYIVYYGIKFLEVIL